MGTIFWAFVPVALLHIFEEYRFPGGFPVAMKRMRPEWEAIITPGIHIAINTAFVLLVLTGALVGERNLVFSLSVAGLLFFNAILHLVGTVRGGRYMPGLITAVALYIPLSSYAFATYLCMGMISVAGLGTAAGLGLIYQLLPPAYLSLAHQVKRSRQA